MACRTADARSFLMLCRAAGTRGVARTLLKVRFIIQIVSGGVDTSSLGLISSGGGVVGCSLLFSGLLMSSHSSSFSCACSLSSTLAGL